jgi:hypothetical protein
MDQNERAELEQELDEGARDFEKGEHEEARAFVARLLESGEGRLSRRAQRAISRIDARWQKRADHPQTFLQELFDKIEFLESATNPGTPCPTDRRPSLRRVLLDKSKCHLFRA